MDIKFHINLSKYKWEHKQSVWVVGICWDGKTCFQKDSFINFIHQHSDTFEIFASTVKKLKGQFSIVVLKEEEIWLASCYSWSFPVFYFTNDQTTFIADCPEHLLDKSMSPEIDQASKDYFLLFGVTPSNKTLIKDLFQLKPGEILRIKGKEAHSTSFFNQTPFQSKGEKTEVQLGQAIRSTFDRYYSYITNKQVLVPLTGGYDSRLLISLLKEYGHNNVICATWGRKNNREAEVAKKAANQLGYKHVFVEYNKNRIADFTNDPVFHSYSQFAGHFSSMPYLQDYFGIKYLLNEKIIDNSCVVMPGHSGDCFAGSHLNTNMESTNNANFAKRIISKYGTSLKIKPEDLKAIHKNLTNNYFSGKKEPWNSFEDWNYHERQCKFISNSNLVYSYFGLEVLMPLFDTELIDFFKNVPFQQRLDANLYNRTLVKHFFQPLNLDFNLKTKASSNSGFNELKDLIVKATPHFLKKMYYPTNDAIFYKEICKMLIKTAKGHSFKHPQVPHKYNAYIVQWYLMTMQKPLPK